MGRKKITAVEKADEGIALASSRVTDALREAILSGKHRPGSRLRQEDLAEEYGISRIPVREALRQLESEGLVNLVPNSGAWIARLDQMECIEIYKIRERLETLALRESCPNLTDGDIAALDALRVRIEATTDIDEFLKLDREFHLLSYKAARMPRLVQMISNYWNSTQQYRRAFARTVGLNNLSAVHHEHALIVDALMRRDGKQASLILYGHIRRTRLQLEAHKEVFD